MRFQMSDHLDVGGEIRKARGVTGQSFADIEKITQIGRAHVWTPVT